MSSKKLKGTLKKSPNLSNLAQERLAPLLSKAKELYDEYNYNRNSYDAALQYIHELSLLLGIRAEIDRQSQEQSRFYEAQKLPIIQQLFSNNAPKRVIAFASSKLKVKEITKSLRRLGLNVGEMHSDLSQAERDDIMHRFRNGHINILVATDIVSRGIDIDDIDLVINFDVPHDPEDYVHRIGRTARAGAEGCAITFVSLEDQPRFHQIEKFLGNDVYKIPLPADLGETPEYKPVRPKTQRKGKGKHFFRKPSFPSPSGPSFS